jgi:hypothetical protein
LSVILERFQTLPAGLRQEFIQTLSKSELLALTSEVDTSMGTRFAGYRYDPVGFVHEVLGETTWSKMDGILESVRDYKITAVPAGHSVSKSHTAARVVAWWTAVHPPGTALTITTATTFQQVKSILWPHIRKMQERHALPGRTNMTEWIVPSPDDPKYQAAYGFSASDSNEAAVQGRHAPHLLIVVDEAGGVSHELGKALWALLTGGHTRMLLIGNPSTEEENTWFQQRCESGRPNTKVIPIPVFETPNFTDEDAGMCHACPPGTAPHKAATHLVDKDWLRDVEDEFGTESAYVEARAFARFPSSIADKVNPLSWLERTETKQWVGEEVQPGRIKLGVDIAADGGDEFVIARRVGFRCKIVHTSAGYANENPVDVAEVILAEIRKCEAAHQVWGIKERVRVKIDAIGVGWGVAGMLSRWAELQPDDDEYAKHHHQGEIVAVNVAETADDSEHFPIKRDEMWWTFRELVRPTRVEVPLGEQIGTVYEYQGPVRLDVDTRTIAQLSSPSYRSDGAGRIQIEKKKEIKKRTNGKSPDRAEAVLLAFYEPKGKKTLEPFTPVNLANALALSQGMEM